MSYKYQQKKVFKNDGSNMRWDNLRKNICPQCNEDFMKGLGMKPGGLMTHPCGFAIREQRYSQIVTTMVTNNIVKNLEPEVI